MHQAPATFEQPGTRWQLKTLLAACPWLRLTSLPGLGQLLRRLEVHWKRARAHVHSPDPDYIAKLQSVRVNLYPLDLERYVFVFEDEFTFYRQPTLASTYEKAGKEQPLAELGWKGNYTWRIAAALNAYTGQVTYASRKHFSLPNLVAFYQQVTERYATCQEVRMAQDNWTVHFHPDVRAALQPQAWAWPFHLPANWPTAPTPAAKRLNLPLRLLSLPTYASWTNPIEKLWRLLQQEVLHLHRFGDDWAALKQAVTTFLDQFAQGSTALLRYVGLQDPAKLYRALFSS
ncbi:MAG: transposase [Anaerolineales bacterium]|nr:transposase [Anaerolineales bacterium]MCB9134955.1 transposase [Anaerolineales bacterium]